MKLLVISFVPLLLTACCIATALAVLSDAQDNERARQTARQVVSDCEETKDSTMTSMMLLLMFTKAHDPAVLEKVHSQLNAMEQAVGRLKSEVPGGTVETKALIELVKVTDEVASWEKELISEFSRNEGNKDTITLFAGYRDKQDLVWRQRALCDALEAQVDRWQKSKVQTGAWFDFVQKYLSAAVGLSVLLSVMMALLLSRGLVTRLNLLTEKVIRLSRLQAPVAESRGWDEIAELDALFNEMSRALLEAVKREQASIACAADVILLVAGDGKIDSVNPDAIVRYGWKSEEIIGQSLDKLFTADDRSLILNAVASQVPVQLEAPILRGDGKQCPCLWSVAWSPTLRLSIAIGHNLSERKAAEAMLADSEARLRLMMERMPAGLLLLSVDGLVRFANGNAAAILGKSANALVGQRLFDLIAMGEHNVSGDFFQLLMQNPRTYSAAVCSSGITETQVQFRLTRFGAEFGEELFLLILTDHTERAQFENLKSRLISMLAHDIASPLITVQTVLELASDARVGVLQPDFRSRVDRSARESENIISMFKSVVHFQRVADEFSSLAASQLSLATLTDEALDIAARMIEDKHLVVTNDVPADIVAVGDADKLGLLGASLLQMVIKACDDNADIRISGNRDLWHAKWSMVVSGCGALATLRASLVADDESALSEVDVHASDLDLVLWKLLLFQCGAKISVTSENGKEKIELSFLSLPESNHGGAVA